MIGPGSSGARNDWRRLRRLRLRFFFFFFAEEAVPASDACPTADRLCDAVVAEALAGILAVCEASRLVVETEVVVRAGADANGDGSPDHAGLSVGLERRPGEPPAVPEADCIGYPT